MRLFLSGLVLFMVGFTHIRTEDRADAPFLRWSKGFNVPIHVHGAGYSRLQFAAVRGALEAALVTWNDVQNADLTFERDPNGRDAGTPVRDGVNVIRFEERALPPEIDPDSVLAWTSPLSVACTGIMLEADITFNAVRFRWSTDGSANDIESVALHEIGHLLGLDHSRDRTAVMFPTVQEDLRRALNADDIAGVRAIYPPARGLACQRNADCGGGEVCLYDFQSDESRETFCGLALGRSGPGQACDAGQGSCDSGCANGLCLQGQVCSAVCAADRDCPAGWSCVSQGDGTRLCLDIEACAGPGDCAAGEACGLTLAGDDTLLQICVTAGAAPDGAACAAASDCQGGICLGTCTRLCRGAADCSAGLSCTGQSIPLGGGSQAVIDLCTLPDVPCGRDRDCPEGLSCTYLDRDGVLANRCAASEGGAAGTACRQDLRCRAGLCEGGLCSAVCRNDGDCPETMECGRASRGGMSLPACVPLPLQPDAQVPDPPRDAAVPPPDAAPDAEVAVDRSPGLADLGPDAERREDGSVTILPAPTPRADEGGCQSAPARQNAIYLLGFLGIALGLGRKAKRSA